MDSMSLPVLRGDKTKFHSPLSKGFSIDPLGGIRHLTRLRQDCISFLSKETSFTKLYMDNQVVRREVQRCDDPFGIPACFYWSVDEVADWVESIGYGKYKENFRSNFINGRKLLTVDACTLPQLGIVHFGDILELASCIKDVLGKNGKGVSWLPPIKGPRFNPHPQRLNVKPSEGRDLDYNWRLWKAEYYKGYTPKESPVTPADFYARWHHEMHTYRLLKAKKQS